MNLSQEEIDAMMKGQAGEADSPENDSQPETESVAEVEDSSVSDSEATVEEATEAPEAEPAAEIAAAAADSQSPEAVPINESFESQTSPDDFPLDSVEADLLGEVGNMCMGAVATTMYTLLDRPVSITTPRVSVHTTQEVLAMYQIPFVCVEVEYIEGIEGKNLLLLKETDAALITDLLMGGDGQIEEPVELNELHMSAINEIMNQMIGASATALSKIISIPVNISTPVSNRVDVDEDVSGFLDASQMVVKVSFDMEIEGLLKSQLLQLMPYQLGKELAKKLLQPEEEPVAPPAAQPEPEPVAQAAEPAMAQPAAQAEMPQAVPQPMAQPQAMPDMGAPYPPQYPQQPYPYPPQGYPQGYPQYPPQPMTEPGNLVDVRPMQYTSFDNNSPQPSGAPSGMGLIYDIPLQVSVELGKARREVNEILEFAVGTVVVLDKIAGDPVEILVNGKLIARGEVVVIEENYGVRITDIITG